MDNDVAGIDEHPVALPHSLDAYLHGARGFEVLDDMFGHGADMTLRSAAGHDHVVGD